MLDINYWNINEDYMRNDTSLWLNVNCKSRLLRINK